MKLGRLIHIGVTTPSMGASIAIVREKQIKGEFRTKRLLFIKTANPDWTDMYENLAHG